MKTTRDSLFNKELVCFQHENGYRFSIDSVLLAHFANIKPGEKILDLGAGCGVISLILHYRYSELIREVTGIEIQEGLAELASKNFLINDMQHIATIHKADVKSIRDIVTAESYSVITCNPPFYAEGSGRTSGNEEARLARHQISCDLGDFLSGSHFALKNRGRAYFIYPSELLTAFVSLASLKGLEPKRIRFVFSYPGSEKARLVLFECVKNGNPGVENLAPLYIYKRRNGDYSGEVKTYYSNNNWSPNMINERTC